MLNHLQIPGSSRGGIASSFARGIRYRQSALDNVHSWLRCCMQLALATVLQQTFEDVERENNNSFTLGMLVGILGVSADFFLFERCRDTGECGGGLVGALKRESAELVGGRLEVRQLGRICEELAGRITMVQQLFFAWRAQAAQ